MAAAPLCCKRMSVNSWSSAKGEFIAASSMVQEVIFLSKFPMNLCFKHISPTPALADNETCIPWSEGSLGSRDQTKHFGL